MKVAVEILAYSLMPAISATMWILALLLLSRAREGARYSAVCGAGGGLVAFALYFLITFQGTDAPTHSALAKPQNAQYYWWLAGILAGLAATALVHRIGPRNALLGAVTFFLTATSSIALLAYFYASPHRDAVVVFTVAALLGILIYGVPFGEQLKKLFRKPEPLGRAA